MRYQIKILNNFIKTKLFKWLFIYILLTGIYIAIILDYSEIFFNPSDVENLLIWKNMADYTIIELLLHIYRIVIYIYIAYNLYIYEYNNSQEFIFLRINPIKKDIFKIIVNFLFVYILENIYFGIIYVVFKKYFLFSLVLYFKSLFVPFFVTALSYLILFIFCKSCVKLYN